MLVFCRLEKYRKMEIWRPAKILYFLITNPFEKLQFTACRGGGPFQASNDRFPLRRIELNYIELKWVELKWNWIELNWMGGGLELNLNGIDLNLKLRWTWIDFQSKRFELTLKWIEFDRIEMKLNWFWIEIEKNMLFRFEIELNWVEWNWINSVWHCNEVKLSSTECKSNCFEIDIEINRV